MPARRWPDTASSAVGLMKTETRSIYSDGNSLLETVNRFKGQAADTVVLVGVPQSVDNEMEQNRVCVATTRGRLVLSTICSL